MIDKLIEEQQEYVDHLAAALRFAKKQLRHLIHVRDVELNQPALSRVPRERGRAGGTGLEGR